MKEKVNVLRTFRESFCAVYSHTSYIIVTIRDTFVCRPFVSVAFDNAQCGASKQKSCARPCPPKSSNFHRRFQLSWKLSRTFIARAELTLVTTAPDDGMYTRHNCIQHLRRFLHFPAFNHTFSTTCGHRTMVMLSHKKHSLRSAHK